MKQAVILAAGEGQRPLATDGHLLRHIDGRPGVGQAADGRQGGPGPEEPPRYCNC